MKNIDKIRAMSAEELGTFLGKAINNCSLCRYQNIPECSGNCEKGITKWLNQEVNPMPKLQVGDIVEVEPHGITPAKRFVMLDSETAVNVNDFNQPQPAEKMQIKDIKLIRLIWRYCSDGYYVVVWRAENEKLP